VNAQIEQEVYDWKNYCEILKSYRRSLNWSQYELAKRLGVTHAIVGLWERGIKEPKISNFMKLAKVFGLSETELLHPSKEVQEKIKQMSLEEA